MDELLNSRFADLRIMISNEHPLITVPSLEDTLEQPISSEYRWVRLNEGDSRFENYEQNLLALQTALGLKRLKLLMGVLSIERYLRLAERLYHEGQLGEEWKYASKLRNYEIELYGS
jgi:hypothetical protein